MSFDQSCRHISKERRGRIKNNFTKMPLLGEACIEEVHERGEKHSSYSLFLASDNMVQLWFVQTSREPAVTGKCPCPAIALITRPRDWVNMSSSHSSASSLSSDQGKCYGLNCVAPKDAEVLTLSPCECDLIWK